MFLLGGFPLTVLFVYLLVVCVVLLVYFAAACLLVLWIYLVLLVVVDCCYLGGYLCLRGLGLLSACLVYWVVCAFTGCLPVGCVFVVFDWLSCFLF